LAAGASDILGEMRGSGCPKEEALAGVKLVNWNAVLRERNIPRP